MSFNYNPTVSNQLPMSKYTYKCQQRWMYSSFLDIIGIYIGLHASA